MGTVKPADIPVVILAGGRGTRLMEETKTVPKPMVTIGDRPILFHIMRYYAAYGFKTFIICLGYKGHLIKDFFTNFHRLTADLIMEWGGEKSSVDLNSDKEFAGWKVVLAETGENSLTARRLHIARKYLRPQVFALTYGDGLGNIDLCVELEFHLSHDRLGTVAAVHPPSRFGRLHIADDGKVISFQEKEFLYNDYINGGFFFFRREFLDRLDGSNIALEAKPLSQLAEDGQLAAYKHEGFWQCMDTMRDHEFLQQLFESGNAPWKVW